jgi:hypothetical protein
VGYDSRLARWVVCVPRPAAWAGGEGGDDGDEVGREVGLEAPTYA